MHEHVGIYIYVYYLKDIYIYMYIYICGVRVNLRSPKSPGGLLRRPQCREALADGLKTSDKVSGFGTEL